MSNKHAQKITEGAAESFLLLLANHGLNLNNEEMAREFNKTAATVGWKPVTAAATGAKNMGRRPPRGGMDRAVSATRK